MKKDSRYQKTETAILATLAKILEETPYTASINPSTLARRSKISLATFYRHYKNIDEIFEKREAAITANYEKVIKRAKTFKQAMRDTLVFIYFNRDYFEIVFKRDNERPVRKIFGAIHSAHKEYNCYQVAKEAHFYEFYGILKKWSNNHFSKTEIGIILKGICYLCKSAKSRLQWISTLDTRVPKTYNQTKGDKYGTKTS